MISTICSQTIRQKSAKVFGKGPEGHKMITTFYFRHFSKSLHTEELKKNNNINKTSSQYIKSLRTEGSCHSWKMIRETMPVQSD